MKLEYFGTAAYDAMPALFCNCPTCRRAREAGGRNLRTRSQACVNGELLLDFSPDTVSHYLTYGFDSRRVQNCLITHSHTDHLYVSDMLISRHSACPTLMHYYAGQAGYDAIRGELEQETRMRGRADVTLVTPFVSLQVAGYQVLPLPANHDRKASSLIYRIEREGKSLLYAHDSGLFADDVLEALKERGRLDLISLDCTGGLAPTAPGWRDHHMNFESNLEELEHLRHIGVVDDETKVVVNHFSHNGLATYEDMVAAAEPYGILVSYDGMKVTF